MTTSPAEACLRYLHLATQAARAGDKDLAVIYATTAKRYAALARTT